LPEKPVLASRRCRAQSKQRARANPELSAEELRCRKPAIPGALVCEIHGGKAPQVKRKARERLLEAADPASAKLRELLDSDDEAVALRAATAILDRSGNGPTTRQVNVDGGQVRYQIEGVDMDAL
jgi:hypothetical protein